MSQNTPEISRPAGRRKTRAGQRGRMTQAAALDTVNQILGDSPNHRDLLIEHLHRLQDNIGYLSLAHLRALAERMNLPMASIYETASFYAHFDLVHDDELPPPAVTIRVCDSLACQMAGAEALSQALQQQLDPASVRLVHAPCMGRCDAAPVLELAHNHIEQLRLRRLLMLWLCRHMSQPKLTGSL